LGIVPSALLADIIDSDEVHFGVRREGMYVVLETNVMQVVELVASVLPLLLLESAGYSNNGGCECGCGVECASPHQRWSCPADIGYACTTDLQE
jgi:Na+/melibiose symporter-like transporter